MHGEKYSVAFKMEVELDDNLNFSGTIWEAEFSSLTEEMPTVKGYIEEDHISFVLNYPLFYARDEKGQVYIYASKEGHEVIYDGYWNNVSKEWVGEWEVEGQTVLEGTGDIFTEVFIGTFEMNAQV